jgi:predicted acetyltransferase
MPVRELSAQDALAYRLLTAGAFGGVVDVSDPTASAPLSPGQTAIGIDSSSLPGGDEGVLAGGARIRHDEIALGGGRVRCGGVAGLAIHPAHRGGGLFDELVTGVIARCAEESLPLSMLYPSNPEIYRRRGYQVVARGQSLVVPLLDLQRLPAVPGRRTVPVTERTMPRLRALYTELTAEDNAMLRREGPLFPAGLPGGGWEALLLVDEDGRDRGYLSWTRPGGDGPGLEVHEILGRDREDLRALLRALGSWSTVTERVRLRVRTEDPVLDVLPGAGAAPAAGAVPLVMMRVIDTAAVLAARPAPPALRGALRLVVEDATVPAGTCPAAGEHLVEVADGRVRAHRLAGPEPTAAAPSGAGSTGAGSTGADPWGAESTAPATLGTVRLDIHAASLLLADARRLGLRAEADAPAEALLDALLAGPRPSVLDAF